MTLRSTCVNLILAVVIVGFNLLINHRGPTLLFMIGDIRFTVESLLYGIRMALMFLIAIRLFMQFSRAMTEEKILCLMANRLPGLALLFSMILRLVPTVRRDAGKLKKLHGRGPRVWMKLLSMTMEDGIIRGISMRERGYGRYGKRTVIYREPMHIVDGIGILFAFGWGACLIVALCQGGLDARFFPSFEMSDVSIVFLVLWGLYYTVPLLMRGREVLSWKRSKRRIITTAMPIKPEMR